MEMLVMIDAFRRSSAARITAVIPYYGYARQDRKDKPRARSRRSWWRTCSVLGTNRVLTMDLHKAQIQGFFDIPVDHLFAAPVIVEYCLRLQAEDLTIVSPDAGGAETRAGVCEAARRRAGDCRQTAYRRTARPK